MKHGTSRTHLDAMAMWQAYKSSVTTDYVAAKQSASNAIWIERNGKYLLRIVDATLFLSVQGLAFRGNDESETSHNRGNFRELISLLKAVDSEFGQRCNEMPSNSKYFSPIIQNELIDIAARQVRRAICAEAVESGVIAVMVDDSKDISHKEQMSFCIRYCHPTDYSVYEEFISLSHVADLNAESLCNNILAEMKSSGLDQCSVIGQCYDGASVMSGRYGGVQKLFRDIHSNALYVHCHAHRLNLVIVNVARAVKYAGEFFSLVKTLYVFITRHKVHEVFRTMQQEEGYIPRELGRLSDTRWTCRYRNIALLFDRLNVILDVLDHVQNNYRRFRYCCTVSGYSCSNDNSEFRCKLGNFSQTIVVDQWTK